MTDPLVGPRRGLSAVDLPLARALEDAAHRAWPPLRAVDHAGWVLRESAGSSRRGNSVWARGDVPDLAAALAVVTRFYTAAGLPPTFQMTPFARPVGLDAALDEAGYDDTGPTDVCTAPLAGLLRAGDPPAGTRPDAAAAAPRLSTAPAPPGRWLDVAGQVFATFDAQRAGTLAVLESLRLPAVYVTLTLDGVPAAVGRGVADGRWLGVYSMATLPAARGRGAARRVLAALAGWALTQGATHAYLQVEQVSTAARRLYAAAGFRPVYRYTYRRVPIPANATSSVGGGAA